MHATTSFIEVVYNEMMQMQVGSANQAGKTITDGEEILVSNLQNGSYQPAELGISQYQE